MLGIVVLLAVIVISGSISIILFFRHIRFLGKNERIKKTKVTFDGGLVSSHEVEYFPPPRIKPAIKHKKSKSSKRKKSRYIQKKPR